LNDLNLGVLLEIASPRSTRELPYFCRTHNLKRLYGYGIKTILLVRRMNCFKKWMVKLNMWDGLASSGFGGMSAATHWDTTALSPPPKAGCARQEESPRLGSATRRQPANRAPFLARGVSWGTNPLTKTGSASHRINPVVVDMGSPFLSKGRWLT
jgi:hypothetical protein